MSTGEHHNLNLLVPLRALLEEANVTRAGERVSMGQSSMSTALAKLREVFNDELLIRVGREYELTPLARQLLPEVQHALLLAERTLSPDGDAHPSEATRTFSLLATDYAAMRLQPALAAVLADAPGISVDLKQLPERPMESERDLMTHDFVVAIAGIGIEGRSADLLVDDYVCLVDPANAAVHDGTLSFEDFIALPQAVAQFGRSHFNPADRRLRELGVDRREPRVTTATFLPLPSIVAGSDLVAVVPRELARRLGPATGTIWVEPPFGPVTVDLKLWWHANHDADYVHTWFRERLVAALHEHEAAATP